MFSYIAQAVMENVLLGIDTADVYIDDVGAFSSSWDEHIALLDTVFRCLCDNGFTINPLKCEWAIQEMDWLGYWLTPRGPKSMKKKIDMILHMDHLHISRDLCHFIHCVNFYSNMWPSLPFTNWLDMKKNAPLQWTAKMQQAFNKMHLKMAVNALSAYPDHNK